MTVELLLALWKVCSFPDSWMGYARYLASGLVMTSSQKISQLLEKVKASVNLSNEFFFKGKGPKYILCTSTPLFFHQHQYFHTCTKLDGLEKICLDYFGDHMAYIVHHEICYRHPSKSSLGLMTLTFLRSNEYQVDNNSRFWKEDAKKFFLDLRFMHSIHGEVYYLILFQS